MTNRHSYTIQSNRMKSNRQKSSQCERGCAWMRTLICALNGINGNMCRRYLSGLFFSLFNVIIINLMLSTDICEQFQNVINVNNNWNGRIKDIYQIPIRITEFCASCVMYCYCYYYYTKICDWIETVNETMVTKEWNESLSELNVNNI